MRLFGMRMRTDTGKEAEQEKNKAYMIQINGKNAAPPYVWAKREAAWRYANQLNLKKYKIKKVRI